MYIDSVGKNTSRNRVKVNVAIDIKFSDELQE